MWSKVKSPVIALMCALVGFGVATAGAASADVPDSSTGYRTIQRGSGVNDANEIEPGGSAGGSVYCGANEAVLGAGYSITSNVSGTNNDPHQVYPIRIVPIVVNGTATGWEFFFKNASTTDTRYIKLYATCLVEK